MTMARAKISAVDGRSSVMSCHPQSRAAQIPPLRRLRQLFILAAGSRQRLPGPVSSTVETPMAGFRALVLSERDGKVSAALETRGIDELPPGDVLVRIRWSTLNYKDGMILAGLGRLVRTYPHIPGIDFAGIVEDSSNPDWRKGDEVILTGWR